MYGKHFASTYTGSMYGAGVTVFAVWGYVIANTKEGQIELNPKMLAATLGASEQSIREAIDYLSLPDPNSRSKKENGKRLIREGEFAYRVPTYFDYRSLKDEDQRREYLRVKKAESRARQKSTCVKPDSQILSTQEEEEVEVEVEVNTKSKPKAQSAPENLHPINYATKILEDIAFPHTQDNLRIVSAAVEAEIKSGKTGPAAYEFIRAGTLDARDEGIEINRFFFADAKYRLENRKRTNGNGSHFETIADRNKRVMEEYEQSRQQEIERSSEPNRDDVRAPAPKRRI